MDDKYFKLYLKYKSKYLAAKKELQNNQFGGEKIFKKTREESRCFIINSNWRVK